MHTGWRFLIVGCVLAFTITAMSGEAAARDRLLGIGWGGAWGVQVDKDMDIFFEAGDKAYFAFDANFEIRLFPTNDISIDFSFDIGETIRMYEDWPDDATKSSLDVGAFKVYAHFWVPQGDGKFFSVAPFIGLRGFDWAGIATATVFEIGSRIGGEVYITDEMTMGFYGRPSFHVTGSAYDYWGMSDSESTPGFEAVFEMTWTVHLPIPRPE